MKDSTNLRRNRKWKIAVAVAVVLLLILGVIALLRTCAPSEPQETPDVTVTLDRDHIIFGE